jgi:hypothetical protein
MARMPGILFEGCPASCRDRYCAGVPDFKLPLYGLDTERGDLAP